MARKRAEKPAFPPPFVPNRPRPLSAVRVGATHDARWLGLPKRLRVIDRLDQHEKQLTEARAKAVKDKRR